MGLMLMIEERNSLDFINIQMGKVVHG